MKSFLSYTTCSLRDRLKNNKRTNEQANDGGALGNKRTASITFPENTTWLRWIWQGHRHNGDQIARRPRMMCSFCGLRNMVIGDWLIRQSAHGLLLAPHWHIRSISYRVWVIYLAPKAFPPPRPTRIRWQIPLRRAAMIFHFTGKLCLFLPGHLRVWSRCQVAC